MTWNRAIGKARKSFYQGIKAFNRGMLKCPLPTNSFGAKEWERGFNQAYTNNKESAKHE